MQYYLASARGCCVHGVTGLCDVMRADPGGDWLWRKHGSAGDLVAVVAAE